MPSDLDEFLKGLGHPGRYQCFVCFLLFLNIVPLAFNNLNMVFLGVTPPHHCKVPPGVNLKDAIPLVEKAGSLEPDQCRVYVDPANHSGGTSGCTNGWQYDYDDGEWGIVGEWDLVCDKKNLLNLVTTLYFGGTLISAPTFGFLSDKFGRKPLLMLGMVGHLAAGCLQFFSSSFAMFALLKVVHGITLQGMIIASSNLNLELFSTAHRTEMAIMGNTVWSLSQFVLVFFAFFIPTWRWFFLATTLPSLFAISYFWLVPESLRWLLVKNRIPEATAVAQRFARLNQLDLTAATLEKDVVAVADGIQQSERTRDGEKSYGVTDLFRTPGIRRTSLVTLYCWFCTTLIYYGLSFVLPTLAGNKYVNFLIGAGVELASRICLYFVIKKFGRRMPTCQAFVIAGLLCIASAGTKSVFPAPSAWSWLTVGCALLCKAVISLGTACANLLTVELYPTVIRGLAYGTCGLVMRLGAMTAPQILLLGEYTSPLLPFLVFGIAAVVAGLLILLLPETRHVSLPDTIEEAEALHSKTEPGNMRCTSSPTSLEQKWPLPTGDSDQKEKIVSGICVKAQLELKDGRPNPIVRRNQNGGHADQEGTVNKAYVTE